ncbi:transposase [Rhodococcus sp. OK302]|uniref:transposase n=1 Tax=Rhodococcus sp. OK302 TaxID=1882769 RepID=UPI0020CF7612|nr:transposase [Rhodococcus sp. OK302]
MADLANRLADHLRRLTIEIDELAAEITSRATVLAPSLLAIPGCGALTAAKILGETAQVSRFHSKDAFARHNAGRTVTCVVVESCATSSLAHREPSNQCRYSSDRSDSRAVPCARARIDRPTPEGR